MLKTFFNALSIFEVETLLYTCVHLVKMPLSRMRIKLKLELQRSRGRKIETRRDPVGPFPVLVALQPLPSHVDVPRVALDEDPVSQLVEKLDGRDPAVRRVARKPARPFAWKDESR